MLNHLRKNKELAGIKGLHNFVICKPLNKIAKELEQILGQGNLSWEAFQYHWTEFKKHCQKRETLYENIIPTAGRSVLAQRLANTTTYTGIINYGALGSGSASPANSNTTLGTETYRKATSSQTSASNIAYISNFYTATETSGTYAEAGWFIDGAASANTGQLFSRFLISVSKAVTETLTVESTFTFS